MSRKGIIKEFQGHVFTYLSDDGQKINKYYSYRVLDGWNIIYESSSMNEHSQITKIFIPDELYEIFTADLTIEKLSE